MITNILITNSQMYSCEELKAQTSQTRMPVFSSASVGLPWFHAVSPTHA